MPIIFAASIPDTEEFPPDNNQVETIKDPEESLVVVKSPISCGNLHCPAATTTICRISSETKKDNLSEIIQTTQCLDNKRKKMILTLKKGLCYSNFCINLGTVLVQNVTHALNPCGKPMKSVSESTTTGSVYHCINCEGNPTLDDMLEANRKSFLDAQRIQKKIQDGIFKTMKYGFGGGNGMRGLGFGYGWPLNPYWL